MLKSVQLILLLAVAGCSNIEQPAFLFDVSGRIEDKTILEASGLARSQRETGLLWVINDNGNKDRVHALNAFGMRLGEFDLRKGNNRDWEDLASFRHDGTPYLMIADIGNNEARHDHGTLYFVPEPTPEMKSEAVTEWTVRFRYPEGPRDAESAAIDVANSRALVLTKRDLPPRLYAVPLLAGADNILEAEFLGTISSLTRPSRQDVEFAPKTKDWWWQPVGMDISQDDRAAVVMTYRAIFYFERDSDQDWYDALNGVPLIVSLGNFENAEAVAFGDNARTVIVTGENEHSRILSVDLEGAPQDAP